MVVSVPALAMMAVPIGAGAARLAARLLSGLFGLFDYASWR